jgi:hypothetical protein
MGALWLCGARFGNLPAMSRGKRAVQQTAQPSRTPAPRPGGLTALIAALWVAAALDLLYWVLFFVTGVVQTSQDPVYLGFERAFPVADAWLGVAAVVCAEGLRRRRAWAVLYGIAAGSAFIYLGLMDLLYDLEHGVYAQLSLDAANEMAIVICCFVFGPFLMSYVWRHRRWLERW